MKSFKFTLQAVRTVREREEQQALRDYVETLRVLEEARRRTDSIEGEIEAVWEDFRRALQGNASSPEITRIQSYCEMLLQRKRELELELQQTRLRANRAFTRYLAAHQACSVVERCFVDRSSGAAPKRAPRARKALEPVARRGLSLAHLICQSRGTIWN